MRIFADVREHFATVLQFDPEHGVRERLGDGPLEDDGIFFELRRVEPPATVDRWEPPW